MSVGCGDSTARLGSGKLALKLYLAGFHQRGIGGRWSPVLADKMADLCMRSVVGLPPETSNCVPPWEGVSLEKGWKQNSI